MANTTPTSSKTSTGLNLLSVGLDGFMRGLGINSHLSSSMLQGMYSANSNPRTASPSETKDESPLDRVYVDGVGREDTSTYRDAVRVVKDSERLAATDQVEAIRRLDTGFIKLATFVQGEFTKIRTSVKDHAVNINKLADQNLQLQRRQRALDDQIKFLSSQQRGVGGKDNGELESLKRRLVALEGRKPEGGGGGGPGLGDIPWWRRSPPPAASGAKPGIRGPWGRMGMLATTALMGATIAAPLAMLQTGDELAIDTTSKITQAAVAKYGKATVMAARRKFKPWYLGPVGESYYDPDQTNNSNDMEWSAKLLVETHATSTAPSPGRGPATWQRPGEPSAQNMDRHTFNQWLQQSQSGVAPGSGFNSSFGSRMGNPFTSGAGQPSAGGFGGNRTFRPNATGGRSSSGARSGSGGVQTPATVTEAPKPWAFSMNQGQSGVPLGGGSPVPATAGDFLDPRTNPGVNPEALKIFEGKKLPSAFRTNNPGAYSIAGVNPNPAPGMSPAGREPGYVGAELRPANEGGYYAKYSTPEHGVNASSNLLLKKFSQGHDSIHGIITKGGWADRGQGEYEAAMAKHMGVGINDKLDFSKPEIRAKWLAGASAHEAGSRKGSTMIPLYNPEVFRRGTTGDFPGGANYSGWNQPKGVDQMLSGKTNPNPAEPYPSGKGVADMMKLLKGDSGGGGTATSFGPVNANDKFGSMKNVTPWIPEYRDGEKYEFNAARSDKVPHEFGPNMKTITLDSGRKLTVNEAMADRYKGFYNELEARGYNIKSLEGYNPRAGQHGVGNATDLNPNDNPFHKWVGGKHPPSDLPPNVEPLAWKYGISWGARFGDPMHFEGMGKETWNSKLEQLQQKGFITAEEAQNYRKQQWGSATTTAAATPVQRDSATTTPDATAVTATTQKNRPAHITGMLNLPASATFPEGGKYNFGSGGANPKFPSTPYGEYSLTPAPAGSIIQNYLKGENPATGKDSTYAFNMDPNTKKGGDVFDPKVNRIRNDMEIHMVPGGVKSSLDKLYTAGCLGIPAAQYPQFVKHMEELAKEKGGLKIIMSPPSEPGGQHQYHVLGKNDPNPNGKPTKVIDVNNSAAITPLKGAAPAIPPPAKQVEKVTETATVEKPQVTAIPGKGVAIATDDHPTIVKPAQIERRTIATDDHPTIEKAPVEWGANNVKSYGPPEKPRGLFPLGNRSVPTDDSPTIVKPDATNVTTPKDSSVPIDDKPTIDKSRSSDVATDDNPKIEKADEGKTEGGSTPAKGSGGDNDKTGGYGPINTGGNSSTDFGPSPGSDGYGDSKDSPDNNGGICAI